MFASGGLEQKTLSDDGIYLMGNAILSVLAGPAQVAKQDGIDQAAIFVVDNPAASGQLQQAAPLFYGNVKVGVDVVPIPIDAPDVSPQITAALQVTWTGPGDRRRAVLRQGHAGARHRRGTRARS